MTIMTEYRVGDKDLPFSECDGCGARNVDLFPIGGAFLCAVCIDDKHSGE